MTCATTVFRGDCPNRVAMRRRLTRSFWRSAVIFASLSSGSIAGSSSSGGGGTTDDAATTAPPEAAAAAATGVGAAGGAAAGVGAAGGAAAGVGAAGGVGAAAGGGAYDEFVSSSSELDIAIGRAPGGRYGGAVAWSRVGDAA